MSEAPSSAGAAGSAENQAGPASEHLSPNQRAWSRFKRNKPAIISGWLLIGLLALIIAWPVALKLSGKFLGDKGKVFAEQYDPDALTDSAFAAPSASHWFGTDAHGRDLLSRILFGAQISLLVGAVGAAVSLVIGVLWGAVSGYLGGRWDDVMMRVVDILYSLPSIIFVIVLVTTLEGHLKSWLAHFESPVIAKSARLLFLFIGLGAVSWLNMARIVRGQVLTLRTRPFVEASRTLGGGHWHVIRRHILPNVFGVVIVYLTLTVPAIVLYESFLSYLGLGIQPPMSSWGSLIADGAGQINTVRVYWWLLAFPGAFLTLTLLALNFLGDGLRDAWDVRANK